MRIYELGDGTPEVAVVGGIHGDEPCGPLAIERLLAEEPAVERPVKFIIANEAALEAGERYLDADLNRVFPGDADAEAHERRLAHDIAREIQGCTTLALHSTQSTPKPMGVIRSVDEVARAIYPRLPVDVLIETDSHTDGRLVEYPHTIEVECGLQGTEAAAENGYELVRAFLAATGALPAPDATSRLDTPDPEAVDVFRLQEPIPKPTGESYDVFVDNFELVTEGTAFAAVDGDPLHADADFYPVLLSAEGYENIFGYVSEPVGHVA
ncbi:succinylglutamate desuccinylase/aspartoacylase domain-containing protein [Halohasta litorea]|uniref:Succinylglutamate desuccinylase/aspartoacylase family protein n=1 Tax=Halohasta litorea TaxID=869891 RepID=A0ABD6D749_9EURY|nr:succinylglutamate desuccinylase/aspartoacylase family protein [Halohasta litorea]MEA1931065.1 succinylglutamate desuccinylase/aspartoacylase family protein [Euryarchaeota archaeon]